MLDWIMKLLGYERVENIKVPVQFKVPCVEKIRCKDIFWHTTRKYQDVIVINEENISLDGYITLILARWNAAKYAKVLRLKKISLEKYQDMYKSYRRKNINRR